MSMSLTEGRDRGQGHGQGHGQGQEMREGGGSGCL